MEQSSPNRNSFKGKASFHQSGISESKIDLDEKEDTNSIRKDKTLSIEIDNQYLNSWAEVKAKGKLPERRSYCTSASYKNK